MAVSRSPSPWGTLLLLIAWSSAVGSCVVMVDLGNLSQLSKFHVDLVGTTSDHEVLSVGQ